MIAILYRAGKSDILTGPTSFAVDINDARAYLQNKGFGGKTLYTTTVEIDDEVILDIRGTDQLEALREAAGLDEYAYGDVTADYLLAQEPVVDALVERGYEWVRLLDTFPEDADVMTWLYTGNEPELEEVDMSPATYRNQSAASRRCNPSARLPEPQAQEWERKLRGHYEAVQREGHEAWKLDTAMRYRGALASFAALGKAALIAEARRQGLKVSPKVRKEAIVARLARMTVPDWREALDDERLPRHAPIPPT